MWETQGGFWKYGGRLGYALRRWAPALMVAEDGGHSTRIL